MFSHTAISLRCRFDLSCISRTNCNIFPPITRCLVFRYYKNSNLFYKSTALFRRLEKEIFMLERSEKVMNFYRILVTAYFVIVAKCFSKWKHRNLDSQHEELVRNLNSDDSLWSFIWLSMFKSFPARNSQIFNFNLTLSF